MDDRQIHPAAAIQAGLSPYCEPPQLRRSDRIVGYTQPGQPGGAVGMDTNDLANPFARQRLESDGRGTQTFELRDQHSFEVPESPVGSDIMNAHFSHFQQVRDSIEAPLGPSEVSGCSLSAAYELQEQSLAAWRKTQHLMQTRPRNKSSTQNDCMNYAKLSRTGEQTQNTQSQGTSVAANPAAYNQTTQRWHPYSAEPRKYESSSENPLLSDPLSWFPNNERRKWRLDASGERISMAPAELKTKNEYRNPAEQLLAAYNSRISGGEADKPSTLQKKGLDKWCKCPGCVSVAKFLTERNGCQATQTNIGVPPEKKKAREKTTKVETSKPDFQEDYDWVHIKLDKDMEHEAVLSRRSSSATLEENGWEVCDPKEFGQE